MEAENPCYKSERLDVRYFGERFSNMSMPLNMLGDLAIINEMILDLASEIYKKEHGARRVPKHFRENHGLTLSSITKGSTVLGITMSERLAQKILGPTDEISSVEGAISEFLNYIETGDSDYEPIITSRLKSVGSMLKDEEGMSFEYKGRTALYDQNVRKKLLGEKIGYQTYETLYGKVTEVDTKKKSFKVTTVPDNGKRIDFNLRNIQDTIQKSEFEKLLQKNVMITGSFMFKDNNMENESVDSILVLDELDVDYRLRELLDLKPGWGERGNEQPLNQEEVESLISRYDEFGSELRLPHIYPTPDGNLQFEWDSDCLMEMELNLSTLNGIIFTDDDEIPINLDSEEGWIELIGKVGTDVE